MAFYANHAIENMMDAEKRKKVRSVINCAVCGKALGGTWVCNACLESVSIVWDSNVPEGMQVLPE